MEIRLFMRLLANLTISFNQGLMFHHEEINHLPTIVVFFVTTKKASILLRMWRVTKWINVHIINTMFGLFSVHATIKGFVSNVDCHNGI